MSTVSKAAILEANDTKTETVHVPEWGGDVIMRGLTGSERDTYEASNTIRKGDRLEPNPENARARLVVRSMVDENGERVFQDSEASLLGEKNGAVIDRLWDVAARLSGITEESVADAEGNSETAPSDGSTTA